MKNIFVISILIALMAIIIIAIPVYADDLELPDSTPTVDDVYCWRNILENDDFFIMFVEDTPYATTPNTSYSDAFIWRLYDTDGTTELAQMLGYDYNDNGYNVNVVGFYFDSDDAPTWGESYYIKLSGSPVAFNTSVTYTFQITADDYSALTDSTDIQIDIAENIISIAESLNIEWELDSDDELTMAGDVMPVLSAQGETFFRGAIYGVQELAPSAFNIGLINITNTERSWDDDYSTALLSQYSGTYIEEGLEAGEEFLDVDYNLAGLLGMLAICAVILFFCIYVGGDVWGSLIIVGGVAVIGARMGLVGMGEVALIVAIMWIYVSAKTWKVV